jgi:hypothetical protein
MTGRPVFGDFLRLALDSIQDEGGTGVPGGEDVQQTCDSLARVIAVMRQYLQDPPRNPALLPTGACPMSAEWERASAEARQALANAAGWLRRPPGPRPRQLGGSHSSWLAHRLKRTAVVLTAGRDLLLTHFGQSAEGTWYPRSEWADILASPQVRRAMLVEMADLASHLAPKGAAVAQAPGWRGSPESRHKLTVACQWLWMLTAAVRSADEAEPVPAVHAEMLRVITSSRLPDRQQPAGNEHVEELCAGMTAAAERARRAAWRSGNEAAWSPAMTITSLRLTAGSSVVISHNNQALLLALAETTDSTRHPEDQRLLLLAADRAGRARTAWLKVALALENFTTDTRRHIGPAAAETSDLALWTGRLIYADPAWTLTSGTAFPARTAAELAPDPLRLRRVIAAVHHATHTLGYLSAASQRQVQTAAWTGRILVPTRSVAENFGVPCLFTAAPAERIHPLLDTYDIASEASAGAAIAIAEAAESVGAPSQNLAAVADIANQTQRADGKAGRDWPQQLAAIQHADAGPVERVLRDLGIHDTELLARATDIDRSSERLILDASERFDPDRSLDSETELASNAGSAAIVSQGLAMGRGETAMLLAPRAPASERAEPEH